MSSRARQEVPDWSIDSSLAGVLGPPPKDTDNDDDKNEEDQKDEEEEEDQEPGVIREPDEC